MDKPLKILMLNYEFPPIGGGGGQAHLNLLKEYGKNTGLTIDVLTSSTEHQNKVEQFSQNITIHKVAIRKKSLHYWRKTEVIQWLWKADAQLKKLLAENSYDLAHAFFGFPTGWLTYRHRNQLPYILSLRGSDVPGANPRLTLEYKLLGPLFQKIWKNAQLLIANSSGLAQRAKRFAPSLNYEVIPNGIDTNRFTAADSKPASKPFKLLAVGRLSQVKRFDLAIRAVYLARRRNIDAELTIAGKGNLSAQLKQLSAELTMDRYIRFVDWVEPEAMPALYRDHHAFILTSISEGMNNAMLEAMASGLPIISTPCEGTEELLAGNGYIVSPATAESIANTLAKITADSAQFFEMGTLSRKKAEAFSWANAADQYLKIYHSVAH
ncbi:MAG: glycosyltransferase [Planctomycetota bacterium]|jgi:glycosyltransferase involved in cell wall biosynthesis